VADASDSETGVAASEIDWLAPAGANGAGRGAKLSISGVAKGMRGLTETEGVDTKDSGAADVLDSTVNRAGPKEAANGTMVASQAGNGVMKVGSSVIDALLAVNVTL